MNTTQLEAFVAVAETLSFARAAERLHVSQPAVTHQIRSLETEVGARLFDRTTRRVSLTADGLGFLVDAETILTASRRALARLHDESRVTPVRLAVGCRSFAHMIFVGDVFGELAHSCRGLHPDLVVMPHDRLHQLLLDGELDVVLDFEGAGQSQESFFELTQTEIDCVCRLDDPLAGRRSVTSDDLTERPLALVRPERQLRQLRELAGPLIHKTDFSRHYLCDSVESVLSVVQAGLAVSVQPLLSLPPDGRLARVPLEGAGSIPFGAYARDPAPDAPVRDFIELVRAHFSAAEG